MVVASFFYALWNRGVSGELLVGGVQHVKGFGPDAFPDVLPSWTPFEWDRVLLETRLEAEGGARGPARMSARVGRTNVSVGAGLVPSSGWSQTVELERQGRGPVLIRDWVTDEGDPLGLFRRRQAWDGGELTLLLPQFASLRERQAVRELEASAGAPRAGVGTEFFGIREYQPGDSLRRIHWRSTARRGELVVREFEPPGVQNLGIFLDGRPESVEVADQLARIAASEAWDCLRGGGRVTLWAPGCEPTPPDEQRNLQALLEWLARYPQATGQDVPPPRAADAIAVTAGADEALLDALEDVRAQGGSVRAWVVGDGTFLSDVPSERASLEWPL